MNSGSKLAAALALALGSLSAHATLISVDGGKLVDNTQTNTMWVADGNLFKTMANAHGDPAGFVQSVINASHGKVTDTPNQFDIPANSGSYALSAYDWSTDNGHMTYFGALAFINYLNSIKYEGYNDWRLPATAAVPDSTFKLVGVGADEVPPASGELSELFYTELGGTSGATDYVSTLNAQAALFHNLDTDYHYGTEALARGTDLAWVFNVGIVYGGGKIGPHYFFATLPVRSGQAPLRALLDSVRADVQNGGSPLDAAKNKFHEVCVELTNFEKDSSTSEGPISDSYLKTDIKAIAAVVGCT